MGGSKDNRSAAEGLDELERLPPFARRLATFMMRRALKEAEARRPQVTHRESGWQQRLPLYALVAANLLPLLGVLLFEWDVGGLLVLFWLENLVIGGYTILRMVRADVIGGLLTSAFFLIHYGGFCAVHGIFVLQIGGVGDIGEAMRVDGAEWAGPLIFVGLLVNVVSYVMQNAPEFFWVPLLALVVSHGISFVMHIVVGGEDEGRPVQKIMGAPYGRIVVLHIAIIAGGFAAMALGAPLYLLVALVLLKIGLDVKLHRRSHTRQAEAEA